MNTHGMTTTSELTPVVSSTPGNALERNSSNVPNTSESPQQNVPMTPALASVTKKREKTKGLELAKIRGRGEKVKLGFSKTMGRATSENDDDLTRYTTELGIVVRQFAPLQARSWEKVSQDAKDICIAHIREKFDLPEEAYVDEAILRTMGKRYADHRSRLKRKFEVEGVVDCPEDMEEADWTYLCDLWQEQKYKEKCDKYKDNRKKPRFHHTAGSKPFHKKKNGVNPDIVETWKETHYSQKGKCWTEGSENVYVSGKHLITYFDYMFSTRQVKDLSMENGSTPLSDEELSRDVLGSKSGYLRGLGSGPKPSSSISGKTSRAKLIRDVEEARQEAAAAQRNCEEFQKVAAEAHKNSEQLTQTVANMQTQLNFLLEMQNSRNMSSNDAGKELLSIHTSINLQSK
ncbi:hypothetical protein Vadar_004272 [Vaccinium darrowii]|uniref:Uncharacterized protein n=1 Tax=Vaccinium darrowii TaxID=229202 RepID=A0ACB7XNG4_9ERIC|nr:hypothetical protein Vadar_004272 [Vaccinium darrowii]